VVAMIGNLTLAAKATGMSRDAHYKRLSRENDPDGEYRRAFENAREEFRDMYGTRRSGEGWSASNGRSCTGARR
jgi:hypothetical protein